MSSKFITLICITLSFFIVLVSSSTPTVRSNGLDTNAKRFARGLPPLPPVSKRKKQRGTRVAAAKRFSPSNVPGHTITGKVKINKFAGGALVGYIGGLIATGTYTPTASSLFATRVSFNAADSGVSSWIDVQDASANRADAPYIGAAGSADLGSGLATAVALSGVGQTPGGAGPTTGPAHTSTTSTKVESAIWQYTPGTAGLTVQWVNSDGTTPTSYLMLDPTANTGGLFATGDPTAFISAHPNSYRIVLSVA